MLGCVYGFVCAGDRQDVSGLEAFVAGRDEYRLVSAADGEDGGTGETAEFDLGESFADVFVAGMQFYWDGGAETRKRFVDGFERMGVGGGSAYVGLAGQGIDERLSAGAGVTL